MKLGSLLAVDIFVRLGGTGEAAQGLGISQSAVIKALRQAEDEFGLSLATTIQGRLVPTPEAQSLVRQAQPLFSVLRRARHEADMVRVGMADRLRVATVPGLAHSILPPAITRTRRDLGEAAAVEIMFDHVREHLGAGEADLGISYGPMAAEEIEDVALGHSPLVCVLSRRHRHAGRTVLSRGDIEGERLISYGPDGVSASDSFQDALIGAARGWPAASRSRSATPTPPAIWPARASASRWSMASSSAATSSRASPPYHWSKARW